jgi:hypothetical protein
MSTGLVALLLGLLRMIAELFLPPVEENADVVEDPAAPDQPRPYARPERLHPFRSDQDGHMGQDGDTGEDHRFQHG